MLKRCAWGLAVTIAAAVVGCGGDDTTGSSGDSGTANETGLPGTDGSAPDTGVGDAGSRDAAHADAAADGGSDASRSDAAVDAASDSALDGSPDAIGVGVSDASADSSVADASATDARSDAATDARSEATTPDAGLDATGDARSDATIADSGAGDATLPDSGVVGETDAAQPDSGKGDGGETGFATATPIKHIVIVFGENISFDHYFGTYPNAENLPSETAFYAEAGAPLLNNLDTPLDPTEGFARLDAGVNLLTSNPNLNPENEAGAVNPFRLAPEQAETNDQFHNYKPEQQASDNGHMDLFPLYTGNAGPPPQLDAGAPSQSQTTGLVMAFFDGNTVSTLWNLAQGSSLNDNSWTTTFGPSTPGAINLISGQTNGIATTNKPDPSGLSSNHAVSDGVGGYTLIGDTDPLGDQCSSMTTDQNTMSGKNIGDLLNAKGITWGWFQGGFDLRVTNANGTTSCARSSAQTVAFGITSADYIPHHEPFQYYASTANPTHAPPSTTEAIGKSVQADGVTPDPAKHQYDTHDFFDALAIGNLPAVVYLKAPAYQDGHAHYSDPIDEQDFINHVVSALQASPEWSSTAIVFAYDDSDGWYDHQAPPIVNRSQSTADALNSTLNNVGMCFTGAQQGDGGPAPTTPLLGAPKADGGAAEPVQGRCGYGTRVPLLVVSPYAKKNYIDHTLTDQTSILRFIEDNWLGGQRIQTKGSFDTVAGSIENMFTF